MSSHHTSLAPSSLRPSCVLRPSRPCGRARCELFLCPLHARNRKAIRSTKYHPLTHWPCRVHKQEAWKLACGRPRPAAPAHAPGPFLAVQNTSFAALGAPAHARGEEKAAAAAAQLCGLLVLGGVDSLSRR